MRGDNGWMLDAAGAARIDTRVDGGMARERCVEPLCAEVLVRVRCTTVWVEDGKELHTERRQPLN